MVCMILILISLNYAVKTINRRTDEENSAIYEEHDPGLLALAHKITNIARRQDLVTFKFHALFVAANMNLFGTSCVFGRSSPEDVGSLEAKFWGWKEGNGPKTTAPLPSNSITVYGKESLPDSGPRKKPQRRTCETRMLLTMMSAQRWDVEWKHKQKQMRKVMGAVRVIVVVQAIWDKNRRRRRLSTKANDGGYLGQLGDEELRGKLNQTRLAALILLERGRYETESRN
ncbi:hypothetical protein BJ165DRAFT_1574749 [Panaeolus papilionaceus]|nr:hypothetical protein BJ165DRAFT_1574749 [Panaeolus papilionaceus]